MEEFCKDCPLVTEVAKLRAKIEELRAELAELKKPLKDASNSSVSPSSDRKFYPKRGKSERSVGGQFGHKGVTKELIENPDEIVEIKPKSCKYCGCEEFFEAEIDKKQIIDIPELKPKVVEYQATTGICKRCRRKNKAKNPVKSKVSFRARMQAMIGYFHVAHHLSYEKLKSTFADIFSVDLSKGTIDSKIKGLEDKLTPKYNTILKSLKASDVIGSDETGMRINAKNSYIWTFQNEQNTLFKTADSRGFNVIRNTIGEKFDGSWISDRFGSQLKVKAYHQLCLAHLIRDCKYIEEFENSSWAKDLREIFEKSIKFRNEKGSNFNPYKAESFREIQKLKKELYKLFSKPPPQKHEKRLYKSLLGRENQLILFLENPKVDPTNNGSERALRNRVIHRKVAGCFRSKQGASSHDVIASIIETAKKQNLNILQSLLQPLTVNT